MAGREGGGSVVGQSHSNSKDEQTATDGTTDTDGSGKTHCSFFNHKYGIVCNKYLYNARSCISVCLIEGLQLHFNPRT